jgi:Fic family protein
MAGKSFNPRQHRVLNRLLDGFEGKLTTARWAALAKTSPDTRCATFTDLVECGVLVKAAAGGRSTGHSLGLR